MAYVPFGAAPDVSKRGFLVRNEWWCTPEPPAPPDIERAVGAAGRKSNVLYSYNYLEQGRAHASKLDGLHFGMGARSYGRGRAWAREILIPFRTPFRTVLTVGAQNDRLNWSPFRTILDPFSRSYDRGRAKYTYL